MKICFKERIFKEMNQFNMRQPFIIAEMSGNHNQSLNRALEIVDLAAEAGVDALKIQTYTADTMTIDKNDGEFFIEDKRSLWKGESLYSLYQKAYTPWEWHQAIFQRCKEKGIIGFSTPFDFSSVDFLEELDDIKPETPKTSITPTPVVPQKKEAVTPAKTENKVIRQQPSTSVYLDSASYKITGTKTKYTVKEGETLTRVSLRFYGTKAMWPYIVKHNPDVIKNPNNVPYGTTIKIPELTKE